MFSANTVATIYAYVNYIIPIILFFLLMGYLFYSSVLEKIKYNRLAKEHMNSCTKCREKGFLSYSVTGAFDGKRYTQTRCQNNNSIISLKWYGNGLNFV